MENAEVVYAIDKYNLDEECVRQVEFIEEAAHKAVVARIVVEGAKARLEQAKAAADIEIRNNPSQFNLAKVTEGTVAAAVVTHPNVVIATNEHLTARQDMLQWEAACSMLEHRKKSLDNLIYLHGQAYYSKPGN